MTAVPELDAPTFTDSAAWHEWADTRPERHLPQDPWRPAMSTGTKIVWTEATWNVASGCTKVSPGCLNCYIARTPPFRMIGRKFDQPGIGGTTGVMTHGDRLFQPFTWKKPRRIFVCSLADLFHADIPDLFVAKTFATMARTPRHTYQVLTKRPARMRALLSSHDFELAVEAVCGHHDFEWPLPNVWVGVSAEDQERADLRIPILMETPAAVRWVSAEPLLGPIDLRPYVSEMLPVTDDYADAPDGSEVFGMERVGDHWTRRVGLDWVVIGGESGPGARPMDLAWAQQIVDQCRSEGAPVLMKQLGTVTGGREHHNIATFPAGLQVREYPEAVTA